ncbi:10006_t:CDS:2, partial [Acaulospora morrowiae]
MALSSWSPFGTRSNALTPRDDNFFDDTLNRFRRDVDRIFGDFFNDARGGMKDGDIVGSFSPRVDVREVGNNVVVHAELPGVPKENVNVEVRDNNLVISGENKKEDEYDTGTGWIRERRFGRFQRTIPLPIKTDTEKTNAKFADGILEITVSCVLVTSNYVGTVKRPVSLCVVELAYMVVGAQIDISQMPPRVQKLQKLSADVHIPFLLHPYTNIQSMLQKTLAEKMTIVENIVSTSLNKNSSANNITVTTIASIDEEDLNRLSRKIAKRGETFKPRTSQLDRETLETHGDPFRGFFTLFWIAMVFYTLKI